MTILPFHSERGCLSYLLIDEETLLAALVDPSDEIPDIEYLSALSAHNASLQFLIETHTHADHISSSPRLRTVTGARIIRHRDAPSLLRDIAVVGGEQLSLGNASLQILSTPGHTNESISIYTEGAVFTGDALIIGGTGRTDFQLGDSRELYRSLHETLGALPDETKIFPAHDYQGRTSSTIGKEKAENPRLLLRQDEFIETMDNHHPPLPELFEEAIEENSR